MRKIRIQKLTHGNIRPYGMIIDAKRVKDSGSGNSFGIILKEKSKGWRIGYLIVRDRDIKRLERHPDSFETFEPVAGRAMIVFASPRRPDLIKAFFLDKPVIVKKGVWHEVVALSKRAEIKIFENISVKTEYKKWDESHLLFERANEVSESRTSRLGLRPRSKYNIIGSPLTEADKHEIDKVVKKTVKEYGEVLRHLGRGG